MITVGEIKKALAKIDGCTFKDKDELDNAILPLFGPLQPHFQGMGFRDVADMLIDKGWVKRTLSGGSAALVVKFPVEKTTSNQFEQPETETVHFIDTTPKTEFNSPEPIDPFNRRGQLPTPKKEESIKLTFDGNDCVIVVPTTSMELTVHNGMFQIRMSVATINDLTNLLTNRCG